MNPADLRQILSVMSLTEYDRGETIFRENDPSDFFVVVAAGRAKVFREGADGRERILEIFGPGAPLGAVALYESLPYPASAAALESTTCLQIPRGTFSSWLNHQPSLMRDLLGSMSLRLVELTNRLAESTAGRVEVRLARLFLKLSEQHGRRQDRGVHIPLSLSRQDLADFAGTTVETSIRIMRRWQKAGMLLTEKNGFLVVDYSSLQAMTTS